MKSHPSTFHQLVNGRPLKERSQQGTHICCFIWLVFQRRCLLLDKGKAAWQFWSSDRNSAVGFKSTVLLSGLAVCPSYILTTYQDGTGVPTAFPPRVTGPLYLGFHQKKNYSWCLSLYWQRHRTAGHIATLLSRSSNLALLFISFGLPSFFRDSLVSQFTWGHSAHVQPLQGDFQVERHQESL